MFKVISMLSIPEALTWRALARGHGSFVEDAITSQLTDEANSVEFGLSPQEKMPSLMFVM